MAEKSSPGVDRKFRVSDKVYGRKFSEYNDEEQRILQELAVDKARRSYYEQTWRQWNFAYQMILLEYAAQRRFNPEIAPEYQVRQLYPDKKMSDYHIPVEFAVITRQIADEMANLPSAHWINLGESEGDRAGKELIFQHVYDYFYDGCNGDVETFKTLLAKGIYGTSFEYIYQEFMKYDDMEPDGVGDDGEVQYKKITRIVNRPRFKNIDIRHVVVDVNATHIDEAEHAFIYQNYGFETFKRLFANTKLYDISGVQAVNVVECYVSVGEARGASLGQVVQVARYYKPITNEMCITANGKRINLKRMYCPIPAINGKPWIPLAVYYDSPVDREFYGIGKCFLLAPFREIKNKLRNMFFDVTKKVAFNTLVIDPTSDFDESSYEFGQPFIRAVPDEVKPLQVQANLQPAIELDKQNDSDIIAATGINFLDTSGGVASESATKTAVRKESQVKLVESGLKYNTADGFKRRALLMKNLIRLHFGTGKTKITAEGAAVPLKIKTKGVKMNRGKGAKGKYNISTEKVKGYGMFTLDAEDLADDFDVVLEGGAIAMTKELKKARQLEAAGFILKVPPDPSNQMPYDNKELVKWAQEWGELPQSILPDSQGDVTQEDPAKVAANLPLLDRPPNAQSFLQNQGQGGPGAGVAPSGPGAAAGGQPGAAVMGPAQ